MILLQLDSNGTVAGTILSLSQTGGTPMVQVNDIQNILFERIMSEDDNSAQMQITINTYRRDSYGELVVALNPKNGNYEIQIDTLIFIDGVKQ